MYLGAEAAEGMLCAWLIRRGVGYGRRRSGIGGGIFLMPGQAEASLTRGEEAGAP